MRIVFFHTFQTEAELLCSILGSSGNNVGAVSAETLGSSIGPGADVRAVLVDRQSLGTWADFDRLFPPSALRLLAELEEPAWADVLPALIDGRVHLDLSLPSWDVTSRVMDAVARCKKVDDDMVTGAGAEARHLLDLADIDEVNVRILTLVAFGLSDKEISTAMCLSGQTIRNRVSQMLLDGSFRNRTTLAFHFLQTVRTDVFRRTHVTPITAAPD